MAHKPTVYFQLCVGGKDTYNILMDLFSDVVPKTAENFRALCTGEKGEGKFGKKLHFKGSVFHSIIPGHMWQGGDFINGNGTGGESIYGETFPDENFDLQHDQPWLLSMANGPPDTNSSQFFITSVPAPWLDDNHVVFGRVLSGKDSLKAIEDMVGSRSGTPSAEVKIVACDEIKKVGPRRF
ncbi:unnamed protein product [Urochloa decumbens]|uniref:Peptidyl-prolyl cis-trans isomerase n=1 Tax=Urochloa decumbens TaxID=240449 RepID=A0ABC8V8B5_9POAL